ncbi:MAG: histidine phosphatase family protein [Oscillospiraceae bacterium]|nr:histidine phosphatase family protein [Oscillospiraceae bacterium]
MKSYTIHLIRHGQTEGNEAGRYIGRTDLPLSSRGERHLKDLAEEYRYPQADVYFTSPLKRCIQTLKILYPQAKPVVIDGFRECDFGAWEGKTAQEIAAGDPSFARWISGGGKSVSPPGGEGSAVFMHRVCESFEKVVEGLLRSGTTSAVIVAHGGTLMTILSAYGMPRARFYDWMTESGRGYSMRITPGLWMRSMVGEVYAKIPEGPHEEEPEGIPMIDLVREAADRAFGAEKGGKGQTKQKTEDQ